MRESKRTFADWIWSLVGVAGIIFIIVAILMLVIPRFSGDPAKDDPEGMARELWTTAREKLTGGDAEGAARDLKQALALVDGRNPVYMNDLGEALMLSGKGDQAKDTWRVAIGQKPFYARPYLNLGRWHDSRGEGGHALAAYRAALALHPEPVPEGLTRRVAELLAEFKDRRQEDLAKIGKSLRANPADLKALSVLLLAELAFLRAGEDAAPSAGIRIALERIGQSLGDLDDLVKRQESGVEDRPDSGMDRAGLGVALLLQGDHERAREVFDAALELSPGDSMSNLGASLSALISGNFEDESIEKTAKGFGQNAVVLLVWGAALVERNEPEGARRALLFSLQVNPSLPETYRLLALTLTGEGEERDRAAALRGYERLGE